jgi:folate-binding Fe-S cluster repair protein YgfZ
MLNLDVLGAVSFTKGCYPGQEVIARVHNLGDVKRRLHRYAAPAAPLEVGAEIVGAAGKAVGEVVRSAATQWGCELLAVVDDAAAGTPLSARGVALTALDLPLARA